MLKLMRRAYAGRRPLENLVRRLARKRERMSMKEIVKGVGIVLFVLAWICGAVLAPGWWKLAAFSFPPYPWYLLVERAMQAAGLVAAPWW